jgi:hypothetical protein
MTISSLSRTERTAVLRWIFKTRRDLNQSELDSHADTCVAGANTRVTGYTDTKVSVSPFSDSYEAIKDVPIAMVATAWDNLATGEVIVLYINEALYFGDKMSHTTLPKPTSRQRMESPGHAEAIRGGVGSCYHRSYRYFSDASGDEWRDLLPADAETDRKGDRDLRFVRSRLRCPLGALQSVLSRTGAADGCGGGFYGSAGGLYRSSKHGGGAVIVIKVASSHTHVDPFDDGYLLEWLVDSVRLTDDNTQRMIAFV